MLFQYINNNHLKEWIHKLSWQKCKMPSNHLKKENVYRVYSKNSKHIQFTVYCVYWDSSLGCKGNTYHSNRKKFTFNCVLINLNLNINSNYWTASLKMNHLSLTPPLHSICNKLSPFLPFLFSPCSLTLSFRYEWHYTKYIDESGKNG